LLELIVCLGVISRNARGIEVLEKNDVRRLEEQDEDEIDLLVKIVKGENNIHWIFPSIPTQLEPDFFKDINIQ